MAAKQARSPAKKKRLTVAMIQRRLRAKIPEVISDVLLPALTFTIRPTEVIVVIANHSWADVFQVHARDACQEIVESFQRQLTFSIRQRSQSTGRDSAPMPAIAMTFDSWLSDPGNQFALATCRGISEAPGTLHNPLYLYGPSGSGKTHLLQAVTNDLRQTLGVESVCHWSGEEFTRSITPHLSDQEDNEVAQQLEQAALICIDGVDALSEMPVAQEELYLLINRALDQGQQLLFSSQLPPKRIPQLEDRLSSRLAWGLSISIDPPVGETKVRLLRRMAGSAFDSLSNGEQLKLLDLHGGDMHQIVALAQSLLRGDVPLTTSANASFDRIISAAAKAYGVRPSDVAGKHRQRPFVLARQAALLLGRKLTDHSLVALGGMVGGRDHSTVLHSLQQAQKRLEDDPDYGLLINRLSQEIIGADT